MQKDVYKDIEDALLAQNYLKEDAEFSPDTEVFRFADPKKSQNNTKTELLDGSTTMYLDAIKDLDTTKTKTSIGKLNNLKGMGTTDFLGETDFLGYTDYLEGRQPRHGMKEDDSYEVTGDENDNPFRNVFGFGPKKKPAKKTSSKSRQGSGAKKSAGQKSSSNHSTNRGNAAKTVAKGAAKGTAKTVSAGKKAALGLLHLVQLIVRLLSFILMLACGYQIGGSCYYHLEDLGEIAYMISYRNYALCSFLILAAVSLLIALISALRILAAYRRRERGQSVNGDYGQGFIPFLLFLLLGIAAPIIPAYLPYIPALDGVRLFLLLIANKGMMFIQINLIGALLCLARKLTHSF